MAELFRGRVLQFPLPDGCDATCRKAVEGILDTIAGVTYVVDETKNTITAYAEGGHESELQIVHALLASGIFPIDAHGPASVNGVDRHVC